MRFSLRFLALIFIFSSSAFAGVIDLTGINSVVINPSYTELLVQFSAGETSYSVESGCPEAVVERREGAVLTLEATLDTDPAGGVCLLTVTLGADIPVQLEVSNASATLTGQHTALISGSVANGNLHLSNIPAAQINLTVDNGSVTAASVSGSLLLAGANGDVTISDGAGSVRIDRANSSVSMQRFNFTAGSNSSITTVNDFIRFTRCGGALVQRKRTAMVYTLRTVNGSARVAKKKGRSVARTRRGTTVRETGKGRASVAATTTNGSIYLN